MRRLASPTTSAGPVDMFIGAVWVDQIYRGEEPARARINSVHFAPGAHTHWHSHAKGQTLHVTEGIGLVGTRDGTVIVMRPGDTVHTPPGEAHWHGAVGDRFMTHLAIWEGTGDPAVEETTWAEPLPDSVYDAAQPTTEGRNDR